MLSPKKYILIISGYLVMFIGVIGGVINPVFEIVLLGIVTVTSFLFILTAKRQIRVKHFVFPMFFFSSFQITTLLYESNKLNNLFPDLLFFLFVACATGLHYIYKKSSNEP